MNIQLNYLYRDGSNYKNYGNVIFANPNNIHITIIEFSIKESLIDNEFFLAKEWNIPELFFSNTNEDDHEYHEFESIAVSKDNPTLNKNIEGFINCIKKLN